MRVLVVEDFEDLATAIGTGLRREGMAVDVVLDGNDALDHLAVTRYDVVVLDRDLPGVHGDEVCRQLAAERSGSRVLMLTAASTVRDRVEGLGLGADDYLPKPFDFAELVARVRALGRRPATAAAPGPRTRRPDARPRPPGRVPRRAAPGPQPQGVRAAGVPARGRGPGGLRRGTAGAGLGRGGRPVHHRGQADHPPAAGQARRPARHPAPSARAATGSESCDAPSSAAAASALRLPRRTLRAQLALLYAAVFGLSCVAVAAVAVIFKPDFLVGTSCGGRRARQPGSCGQYTGAVLRRAPSPRRAARTWPAWSLAAVMAVLALGGRLADRRPGPAAAAHHHRNRPGHLGQQPEPAPRR